MTARAALNSASSHAPLFFLTLWCCSPMWAMASSFLSFLVHTQHCSMSADKWSAHCRDLYMTTHNSHKRQNSIPPVGFKSTILEVEGSDPCLRPHGHWECPMLHICIIILFHASFWFSFHEYSSKCYIHIWHPSLNVVCIHVSGYLSCILPYAYPLHLYFLKLFPRNQFSKQFLWCDL